MKESKHGYSQAVEGILPKAIVVHDIGRSAKENKPRTIAFTAIGKMATVDAGDFVVFHMGRIMHDTVYAGLRDQFAR
jgi:hypothetical protein